MAKRKPTVGEREEMRRFKLTLEEVRSSGHAKDARRIDRAVRKAAKESFWLGHDYRIVYAAGRSKMASQIADKLCAKYGVKP